MSVAAFLTVIKMSWIFLKTVISPWINFPPLSASYQPFISHAVNTLEHSHQLLQKLTNAARGTCTLRSQYLRDISFLLKSPLVTKSWNNKVLNPCNARGFVCRIVDLLVTLLRTLSVSTSIHQF